MYCLLRVRIVLICHFILPQKHIYHLPFKMTNEYLLRDSWINTVLAQYLLYGHWLWICYCSFIDGVSRMFDNVNKKYNTRLFGGLIMSIMGYVHTKPPKRENYWKKRKECKNHLLLLWSEDQLNSYDDIVWAHIICLYAVSLQ